MSKIFLFLLKSMGRQQNYLSESIAGFLHDVIVGAGESGRFHFSQQVLNLENRVGNKVFDLLFVGEFGGERIGFHKAIMTFDFDIVFLGL